MYKIRKIVTLIPLLAMLCGCSDDPSPKNQRVFNRETEIEYNTLNDVAYYGEGIGGLCPSTGEVHVLVVPVEFSDYPADEIGKYYNGELTKNGKMAKKAAEEDWGKGRGKEAAREDIRKVYFGEPEETQWHSLASYYRESSYGHLNFSGLVAEWYQAYTDFETQDWCTAYDWAKKSSAQSLCAFILKDYSDDLTKKYQEFKKEDGTPMFNTAKEFLQYFDSNSDGYLDLIEVVYSAPYYATYTDDSGKEKPIDNDKFWAYCGSAAGANEGRVDAPVMNKYAFQSYYTIIEGGHWGTNTLGNPEWKAWTPKEISDGIAKVDAHTITHETGHGLGLPDYYDYDYQRNPAGKVDMMDNNVGDHNSHSKALYGWVDPIIVTGPTQVKIRSFTDTGDCIYVPYRGYFNNHTREGITFHTEYLAIELYTPTGVNKADSEQKYAGKYPECPKEPGLKVFHVDARLGVQTYNTRTGTWDFGGYTETLTHSSYTSTRVATSNTGSRRVGECWELQFLNHISDNVETLIIYRTLWKEGDALNDGKNYPDFVMNETDENGEQIPFGYRMVVDSLSAEGATITFYAA